jgi:glycyl-tRNA synthetase beta chain
MLKDGKEFTLMQGLIGSYYARESREPDEVVEAIREHYRPRSPGDEAPRTSLGALLSIADRLDTMAGCFLAGFVPTGSQDPYALRRQANGLLRLLESRPNVALSPLLERAVGNFGVEGKDEARARLVEFMQTRMSAFLKDKGIAYDVVAAVSRVAWDAPAIAAGRARAMAELRGNEPFELLITGARRVGNILADDLKVFGAPWELLREAFLGTGSLTRRIAYDKSKFDDDAETSLHGEIATLIPRLEGFDELTEGKAILSSLSGLGGVIDRYFDSVLVNVPDDALRTNRHHFLAAVFALFAKYADFSQIVEEGP